MRVWRTRSPILKDWWPNWRDLVEVLRDFCRKVFRFEIPRGPLCMGARTWGSSLG